MKKMLEQYSREKEEQIKKFWKSKKIPEKARKANAKGKKFFMVDGPPYATGHIHMGTALNKILKDVTIRHKRMQGFNVRDQPGYDTHGLPIENKVEQKLGFKTKKEIEDYGVKKFVDECRSYATEFIDVMNEEFDNLGVWMDWKNPYLTLKNEYIEAVWWTFKKADEKGLLYLGKYSVHVCPRCGTAVAYNEIEYGKQTDKAIYVKFPLRDTPNTFLVIWTTTPWTLPGNAGVMVHPKFDYSFVELSNGEQWIIAKEKVQEIMGVLEAGYREVKVVKGKELEGLRYENPLKKDLNLNEEEVKNAYRVILSDRYVNLEEGTGLVHTAPGHGKEDYEVGTKAGLPALSPVKITGEMTEEAGKYAGKKAREVDGEIISDLENGNFLVYKHDYSHDYPFCWRCKSPLLMIALPQWFFKILGIQKKLLELNEKTNWVPAWGKDRFRNWLEGLADWPVSRERYWGTPLPIWVCKKCGNKKVVGSLAELSKLTKVPKDLDLHKPEIDEIKIPCDCGDELKRVPEVLDVWFDSGVCTWGSLGYPRSNKLFKKFWPADVNIEGTDQIRGWWNSQLITSVFCFDDKPFDTIVMHGMLALGKSKMSKSAGNFVAPAEVIEKYNRDYLRFFLVKSVKAEDIEFDWGAFKDIHRFFNIFWNTYNFAGMYLDLKPSEKISLKGLEVEDKWILSRLNSLTQTVLENYNNYTYPKAVEAIEEFVLEDLSRTYIKLVRDRVGTKSRKEVSRTLNHVIYSLLRLLAPIAPHITEYIYQDMRSEKMPLSVHFLSLPVADKKLIDLKLEEEMKAADEVIQTALALREEQKLRRRWPLKEIVLVTKSGKEFKKTKNIIASSSNVKKVREAKTRPKGEYVSKEVSGIKVFLNVSADTKLKEEWELRELVRRVQDARKQAKLHPSDKVVLEIASSDEKFLKKFKKQLEKETNTRIKKGKGETEKLLEREFFISIKK